MADELILQHEHIKKAEAMAKNIGIPSQPAIVVNILHEINKDKPDLKKIADLVSADVAITARLLKIANSPFFSRGNISSPFHAVQLLGVRNFYNIILLCSLEDSLQQSGLALDAFWIHARRTAIIAEYIAKKYHTDCENHAYLSGLFHDVGVVLMMKKFHDYNDILRYALYMAVPHQLSEKFDMITGYENDRYTTNHSVLGYIMAKSWNLHNAICDVILHHHAGISIHRDAQVKKLCALLHVAEFIEMSFNHPAPELTHMSTQLMHTYADSFSKLAISQDKIISLISEISELAV